VIGTVCRLRLGNAEDQLKATEAELKDTKAELASKLNEVTGVILWK